MSQEPWKVSGTGTTWSFGPQTIRISSSSTIVAPSVIRIWNRCWPYTGRTIARSSAMPSAMATSAAASRAPASSATLAVTEGAAAQPQRPLSSTAAVKPA